MNALVDFWTGHGTKLLGIAGLTVSAALLVPDLIPAAQMKYWLFANILLDGSTVKRGFTNSSNANPSA